jgi:hypothetical protein
MAYSSTRSVSFGDKPADFRDDRKGNRLRCSERYRHLSVLSRCEKSFYRQDSEVTTEHVGGAAENYWPIGYYCGRSNRNAPECGPWLPYEQLDSHRGASQFFVELVRGDELESFSF